MTDPSASLDSLRPTGRHRAQRVRDSLPRFPGESPSAFFDECWPTAAAFGAFHITSSVSKLELVRVL